MQIDKYFRKNYFDGMLAVLLCLLIAILPLEHVPALRKALLIFLFMTLLYINLKRMLEVYRQTWPMLLWAGFCALSWFWSIRPQSTSQHLRHDLLYGLLAFGIGAAVARRPMSYTAMLWGLLLCSLLNMLTAFFGHYLGIGWVAYYYADVGYSSTIAIIGIAYVMPLLLEKDSNNWPAWGILIASLATGMLSMNRMFIMALLFMLLIILCLKFRVLFMQKSRNVMILLFLLILVTSGLWAIRETALFQRFGMIDEASNIRWEILRIWLHYAIENPLLGIGFGRDVGQYTLGVEHRDMFMKIDPFASMHSHNMYLNAFLETGAIGLILFLGMWLSFLSRFYHQWRNGYVVGLQGLMVVLCFLLKNITDVFLLKSVIVLLFGIIGYLLNSGCLAKQKADSGIAS